MSIEISGVNAQTQPASASSRQSPDSTQAQASSSGVVPVDTVNTATEAVQQSQSAEHVALSDEKLQAAVEKMNELMQSSDRSLQFSVDDSTEKMVVKVMDMETQEIIRQIPSEETLKFSEFLEGMVGLIFDQKA
ncbi:flagellar protein FlaG [Marinobacterium maritimum]|uniref:Flagellar protein FlaG n=1 Tax=Marinobacterium maritimum TaxID=500162 RepID=A0ABN1I4Z3_9GAMM